MKVDIKTGSGKFRVDLEHPLDISIPLRENTVNAFHARPPRIRPYESDGFTGSVKAGASVNFYDVTFNPHGNGTHTECLGHITRAHESLPAKLKYYHYLCRLVTVEPRSTGNDLVIDADHLKDTAIEPSTALAVRTLPNGDFKLNRNYSGDNPPWFTEDFMTAVKKAGILHLLTDLPSVDKEEDGGALKAHKAFWSEGREHCTITELIYVPESVPDGLYLLNLQVTSLELDASPSKPVLYKLMK